MFTPQSTSVGKEQPNNLVELLRWRAVSQPDHTAYTFLTDGAGEEENLTHAELERRARAIAAALQALVGAGDRVLLLLPPGLDYIAAFFGCICAGAVAVPAYPPRLNRNLLRLENIIADAEASLALTTSALLGRIQPVLAEGQSLSGLRWLTVEEALTADEEAWQQPVVDGESLAFLQYTSGSTSSPKGVMVRHRNLLHNEALIRKAFAQNELSVIVGWLPLFHDMGLVGNVLQPLFLGARSILMSPTSFLQRPVQWLQAITRYQATTSGGPNFAYDLCVRRVNAEQLESLDLSSWTVAFNGAELVRQETMESFAETFAPCGFRRDTFHPCYGLAEATLLVSVGQYFQHGLSAVKTVRANELARHQAVEALGEGGRGVVDCGVTGNGQKILIVDPATRVKCPTGAIGEIWVSGPSVTSGYWKRPEENASTFGARLTGTDEGPFLRSGDLGFMQDDRLFVTGRLKELIIIRGLNHYPQDIELTVGHCDEGFRPGACAAFSVEVGGEERLVVVQEVERRHNLDLDHSAEQIRQAVMERHELHVYCAIFIKAGSLPKTSSGKIRHHACRQAFLEGNFQEVFRSVLADAGVELTDNSLSAEILRGSPSEERRRLLCDYLLTQVARVVKMDSTKLDSRQNLTVLGLDSLMAIELSNLVEHDLGVVVPVVDFLQDESISRVAEQILERLELNVDSPRATPGTPQGGEAAEFPLSYIQRALWFIHRLAPEIPAYNIAFATRVFPAANAELLRSALQALIERHSSLRTTFSERRDGPVQRVEERATLSFDVREAAGLEADDLTPALESEAYLPFDLELGPLFKAILFKGAIGGDVLLLVVHHIVFDGWSLWVLLDELATLYAAQLNGTPLKLPSIGARYQDFVRWQSEMVQGTEGEQLWDYWGHELEGELPVLNLASFRARPTFQTFRGASHPFNLEARLLKRLRALARANGATLYMVLLAAFQVLLYRYTGQDDFTVGSPTSARGRNDFDRMVGCFFNAFVLRARLNGELTFSDLLTRVRRTVLGALAHQDYPSHLLAERLGTARDTSLPPLFQVSFILQKPQRLHRAINLQPELQASRAHLADNGFAMQLLPLERKYVRTDLELEMIEADEAIFAALQYNTDLFDAEAIERMAAHFLNLLQSIAADPEQRLDRLPLVTDSDAKTLLTQMNNSGVNYPSNYCVHELFSKQAASTPHHVAAFREGAAITYGQLEQQSDALANLLRELTR